MPKTARQKLVAIACEDGSTAIMQLFADVIIEAEVRRAALPSPPVSWREIDDAEAKRIRDARPKPERKAAPVIEAGADVAKVMQELAAGVLEVDAKADANAAMLVKRVAELEAQIAAVAERALDKDSKLEEI